MLGISIDEPRRTSEQVAGIATEARTLWTRRSFDPGEILVNADYLGEGYGMLGAAEIEAIRLFARQRACY